MRVHTNIVLWSGELHYFFIKRGFLFRTIRGMFYIHINNAPSQQNCPSWFLFFLPRLLNNVNYDTYSFGKRIQRWVLATFFRSLFGRNWRANNGWMSSRGELSDECLWQGIVCDDASGAVVSIEMIQNNLEGAIPMEISLLGHLGES